jgi:hypothetical protein
MQGPCAFPGEATDSSRFETRHIERDAGVTSNSVAFSASSTNAVAIASLSLRLVGIEPAKVDQLRSRQAQRRSSRPPGRAASSGAIAACARRQGTAPWPASTFPASLPRMPCLRRGLPDSPGFHMRARIAGCSPGCGLMDCQNKRENSRNRLLIGCPRTCSGKAEKMVGDYFAARVLLHTSRTQYLA